MTTPDLRYAARRGTAHRPGRGLPPMISNTVLTVAVVASWVAVGVAATARHGRTWVRALRAELRQVREGRR